MAVPGADAGVGFRLRQLARSAAAVPLRQHRCCRQADGKGLLRHGYSTCWRSSVLYTLVVVLLILWVAGLVTSFTAGGLLHLLLVVAVVLFLFQVISGRRV